MNDFKPHRYQVFNTSSEITPESRIMRYMTFEKFCWLIETSKLYHTRLDLFKDPFEGAVTDEYARLRDSGAVEPYFSPKEHERWTFKTLRVRSYATCWHASPYESDAQWQLYASGGAGVAVTSTIERLKRAVDFSPHVHGLLSRVVYVDFQTHDMLEGPFETPISAGFLKRKSFEHEKEVRGLIQTDFNEPPVSWDDALLERMRTNKPRGVEATVNLLELIQAIVISPIAPDYVEGLVRTVTKRHGLDHLVEKSKLGGSPVF